MSLPISRYVSLRSWDRLVERMVVRRSQLGSLDELVRLVVPKPVLLRLETLDGRMPSLGRVMTRVLGR